MSFKIKISKKSINIFVMALMIFSAAALWTSSTIALYILITGLCAFYIVARGINTENFRAVISSRFFLVFTLILLLFGADAVLRTRAGEYNHDFQLFTWISVFIAMMLMVNCKTKEELIEQICSACLIAAVAICTYMVLSEKNLGAFDRLGNNLSGNVITVGMYLGTCALAILYKYLLWHKKTDLLVYVIVNIFMLLTGSKLVFFNMVCAMLMFIKIGKPSKAIRRIVLILIMVIALVILIFTNEYLYNIIGARTIDFLYEMGWINSETAHRSNSTIIRLALIQTSVDIFKESPIIGSGFGVVASKPPYYSYAHNNFLEVLACYGLCGFILFYSMHVSVLRKIKRVITDKNLRSFLGVSILNILFYDITQITYSAGWLNYFGIIIGAAFIIVEHKSRERFTYELDS